MQIWFAQLHEHILKLSEYGLNLVEIEPNLCVEKSKDVDRKNKRQAKKVREQP